MHQHDLQPSSSLWFMLKYSVFSCKCKQNNLKMCNPGLSPYEQILPFNTAKSDRHDWCFLGGYAGVEQRVICSPVWITGELHSGCVILHRCSRKHWYLMELQPVSMTVNKGPSHVRCQLRGFNGLVEGFHRSRQVHLMGEDKGRDWHDDSERKRTELH